MLCAYLSIALLVGLGAIRRLRLAVGGSAALVIALVVVKEGREGWRGEDCGCHAPIADSAASVCRDGCGCTESADPVVIGRVGQLHRCGLPVAGVGVDADGRSARLPYGGRMGYWHDMHGWGYGWMIGMMLFWVAVIGLGVWAALALSRRDQHVVPSARDELDRRLARGEITPEEYQRRRELIGS
jgi:uncharacterized membrane protein